MLSACPTPSARTGSGEAFVVDLAQRLRGVAIVVPQHPTKSFATFDLAGDLSDFESRIDDFVFEALVIALLVIVGEILANGVS